ncbi:D-alanyl-D-alanine carboxypeptidase family protein [Faecalicatena contorta]|uniref:D-alanyl-D-alanine carboxypeptidase family protein n=1 Tax=Faecalicatena contorta TaxID=39482 RepID=UPI001F2781A7|nr:D-alanyl-D-alanine carboxypeptidase [Faecalicatena contorta]
MKCIDKKKKSYKLKRRNRWVLCLSVILVVLCCIAVFEYYYLNAQKPEETLVTEYESSTYTGSLYKGTLFADDLCVVSKDIALEGAPDTNGLYSAALFDVEGKKTDFSYHIHEKVFPASTTKILTALVAINHGDLSDVVTVSENADAAKFASDEQTCGIKAGDKLTLKDLLYGLLLYSGNDNAVAIAEHIAGSQEAFAEMMNAQAQELMATKSHFVNSNGLHDENHYTTAYDLYLIFNECIRHPEFVEIIGASSYTASVTGSDGTVRDIKWEPTNHYALGEATPPENATIVGGKTGTTLKAGNCLILLEKDQQEKPFISIIMGAQTKDMLYQDMTTLIQAIPQ